LIDYWPINNNVIDNITGDNIVAGASWQFAPDRFNNTNSSIFFNSGYVQVPEGVYFNGEDFTIIFWVKTTVLFWQSLLDFGNTNITNNVIFQVDGSNMPNLQITTNYSNNYYYSNKAILNNQWNQIAVTLSGLTLTFYINGLSTKPQSIAYKPLNEIRQTCFIGRSNGYWIPGNPNAIAYLDQIQIYNRTLSGQEIIDNMMSFS